MILCLDNAPYHHGRSEDSFFCSGRTKEDIQAKLKDLKVKTVTVQPYRDLPDTFDAAPTPESRMSSLQGWTFFEHTTGKYYMVNGLNNEGLGT